MRMTREKILSAIVAGVMVLSLTGCNGKAVKCGVLSNNDSEKVSFDDYRTSKLDDDQAKDDAAFENILSFDSTDEMLMALETGSIQIASMPDFAASYFLSKHPDYLQVVHEHKVSFQMAVLKENAELYEKLEAATNELINDGTVAELTETYLNSYKKGDLNTTAESAAPTYNETVEIEGAPTLKVAITGDMAPLDYVDVEGKPAGFNVALMNKIAEKLNVNTEYVSITAGARAASLSSGKSDVVFWFQSSGDVVLSSETLSFTSPYYSGYKAIVGKFSSTDELNKNFMNGAFEPFAE